MEVSSSNIARRILFVAIMVLAVSMYGMAKANNGAGDGLCGMTQEEMLECRPAVATGTETSPPPTAACCGALAHADLKCFCQFQTNRYLPLFGINATRAMQLPSKCDPNQTVHC